jgi:hypothetical protein
MAIRAGRCTVTAQPKIDRRRRRGRQAPALIVRSFLTRSFRAGQPSSGTSAPRRDPFGSCVSEPFVLDRASLTIRRANA